MRVFVTGASGFIGSAVVPELLGAGHQVVGLARSDEGAAALVAAGAEVQRGTLDDLDLLRDGAASSRRGDPPGVQARHRLFGELSRGHRCRSPRHRDDGGGACWFWSASGHRLGDARADAGRRGDRAGYVRPGHRRAARANAQATLALAAQGVRSAIVRLAPTVHDAGDHGFVATLIGIARAKGGSGYIGDGANRWPAVHRQRCRAPLPAGVGRGPGGRGAARRRRRRACRRARSPR